MEPLKKVQVEGFLMFAEPQELFGNLDELCYVSVARAFVGLVWVNISVRTISSLVSTLVHAHFWKTAKLTADAAF